MEGEEGGVYLLRGRAGDVGAEEAEAACRLALVVVIGVGEGEGRWYQPCVFWMIAAGGVGDCCMEKMRTVSLRLFTTKWVDVHIGQLARLGHCSFGPGGSR